MVALLTTRFSGRESDVTDLPPRTPGAAPLLFGRSIGHGGRIEFERAHRGALSLSLAVALTLALAQALTLPLPLIPTLSKP